MKHSTDKTEHKAPAIDENTMELFAAIHYNEHFTVEHARKLFSGVKRKSETPSAEELMADYMKRMYGDLRE